jgi:hypothetical protein
MTSLPPDLEQNLCKALCAQVKLIPRPNDVLAVSTPLSFPDGDSLPIFIKPLRTGGLEFTDLGNSLMRLSYEVDPASLREGTRGKVLGQVLADYGIEDRNGELVLGVSGTEVGVAVFRFSQALTRVHDLSFLNRTNVESTFYEDLQKSLEAIVQEKAVLTNYLVPGVEQSADYPVDYFIDGGRLPLFVFGVPNRDKARLATIIIQHLISQKLNFDSAVVFRDAEEIPRRDVARLANVANDLVMSVDAQDDLDRKIKHRLAAA